MTSAEQQLDLLRQYESRQEWDAAESLCIHLLKRYPRQVDLLVEAAGMASRRQAPSVAESLLYRALAIDPLNTSAYLSLGMARYEQGDPEDAERYFRKALLVDPTDREAYRHLGTLLNEQGRFLETVALFGEVHRRNPESSDLSLCLADASYGAGQLEEAYTLYRAVLDLQADNVNALISLGVLCEHLDRLDEAWRHLVHARELAPDNPKVYLNLGGVCRRLLKLDDALAHYEKALSLRPGYPTALWNICQIHLLRGQYREGFRDFDSRLETSQPVRLRRTGLPFWNGESASGKRILVQTEQAYGDTLQFARYIPLLSSMGAAVVLENHLTPLNTLLLSLKGPERIVNDGAGDTTCDSVVPLLSLPRLLSTTLDSIPNHVPYLEPSAEKRGMWRARLAKDANLKVGICWAGRKFPDQRRSIPPSLLAPLSDLRHISWYSLQVDEADKKDGTGIAALPLIDLTGHIHDFDDTAALITCLDLVITIDSAVAHLAGALAAPTWILLPFAPDWRWMLGRDDTPWYPTARLFRQAQPGAWSRVIADVTALLHKKQV
ncbi:tetratricopeptide repeat protein [Geobacter sp. AOG2]|uniref:tetratricopeptide repeat protein n=1 Tax=Geobacter sp. AOG2 TaxID=1566347 RepID=UPI001CC6ECFC|nr:tetratricopeptide repeat protein [Geobacter sp. AOG2]GFE59668.1 hypothetical protein AOG2_02560 [Geobacter sp. AOG2]